MRLISIKINNILSISDIEIAFGDSGLILLDGWNFDDETANGAGKTAIFNAVSYALYGKMPRNITSTEYLRKGTKTGYAEIEFEASGSIWMIRRGRPTSLVVHKNGAEYPCTAEEVDGLVDLTYQQFLMTMYAAQLKSEKFILLNDSAKKDFLLNLLNLNQFNEAKTKASTRLKVLESEKIQLTSAYALAEQKIELLSEAAKELPILQTRLLACDTSCWQPEIKQLEQVPEPDFSRYQKIHDGIQEKRKHFNSLKMSLALLRQEREVLLRTKKSYSENHGEVGCPHCGEMVTIVAMDYLEKSTATQAIFLSILTHNKGVDAKALAIKTQMDDLDSELLKENELNVLVTKLHMQQSEDTKDYRVAAERIGELKQFIAKKQVEAQFIEQNIKKIDINELKVKTLETQVKKIATKIEELRLQIQLTESAQQVLSPAGIQAYVVDTLVDKLNERITHYVSMIWPNASYVIKAFKENKSGEIRSKFSEQIVLHGKERSLGSLSGGELRCISLTVDLAVMDIVASFSGALMNPIILDEPFDGMDNANRERAIDLLYRLSQDKQFIVIDHSSEARALFSSVIKVVKSGGVTTLT